MGTEEIWWAMRFEYLQALRDLDQRTNSFLVSEIFAHGDMTTPMMARGSLQSLDPGRRSSRILIEMLRVTDKDSSLPG